jgi:hypothetical protein
MDPRTQERVEEWDSRPFDGGFDGLSDLAAADFSGAVSSDSGTWLFMLNGRIVGVFDGAIGDFENAAGTRYEAPHPSLPLLCTMEERGGETRAKYYTNETPLREVDDTLQSGSFTGYIELSENVLSGDYFAVYYGGRRMAAAYIGNAERLLTGEEAFDRAADEVGIYEVVDVEIEVTDVPGTADPEPEPDDSAPEGVETDPTPASESTAETEPAGPAADADDAGRDESRPEPTADPTTTSIESIDISDPGPGEGDVTASDPVEEVSFDAPSSLTGGVDRSDERSDDAIDETPPSAGDSGSDPPVDIDLESGAGSDRPLEGSDASSSTDRGPTDRPESSTDTPPADPSSPDEPAATDVTAPADESTTTDVTVSTTEEPPSSVDPDDVESEPAAGPDRPGSEPSAGPRSDAASLEGTAGDRRSTIDATDGAAVDDVDEQLEREEEWRETRRIPSIDPEDGEETPSPANADGGADRPSTGPGAGASTATAASDARSGADSRASEPAARSEDATDRSRGRARGETAARSAVEESSDGRADRDRAAALAEKLETVRERRDALETKAEELAAERDRLRSEKEDLSARVERLQSRIEDLETELERAREPDEGDAEPSAGIRLSAQQALSGTNLFVRYGSKSRPTLRTAHDGDADRSEVASNLRLEHHTQFDSADAAVDGEPYEAFLPSTMEYRFVDWFTEVLLYEIRDTGNADGLADLYDAIPRIDRAELDATISLEDDDTEDVPDQVAFDIVAYDKRGNPLVLATLNDSREPASKELLAELEEAASAVKANYPDLAAAIAVTSSYFEPGALEVAEQATSGGFLSRSSKLSYVTLSRKTGYHLCLVESRSEGFHMSVPEL